MSGHTSFRFESRLSPIQSSFMKTAIFLPSAVVRKLPPGRIRMEGTFNGAFFALAVQNLKDGSRYFSVGGALRKAASIKEGDRVEVVCKMVDPDKLDIPEELEAVLEQDAVARKTWDELTSGYKRSLIHYITSVRNVDSRINRALDLINRAKAGLLHGQKKARRSKE